MTDFYDQSSDREMADRELAIKISRSNNMPLKFTGHCLFCNESLTAGRFCSVECRNDSELEAKIKGIIGKRE